jgi:hypothetical protein
MSHAKLIAHWPLASHSQDACGANHGVARGVIWRDGGAAFDGQGGGIEVADSAGLQLGSKPFTVSAWIKCPKTLRGAHGDVFSKFDTARRCGVNLWVAGSAAAYSSFGDSRYVHAGIDDGYLGPWRDCGRPAADNPLVSTLVSFEGGLYAGVTDAKKAEDACRVYRWEGGQKWADCGRVGGNMSAPSVMSMITHDGALYAGTGSWDWGRAGERIAANQVMTGVYRYEGGTSWRDMKMPGEGQRVICMASFEGALYVGLDRGGDGRCFRLKDGVWEDLGTLENQDGVPRNQKDNFECLMPVDGVLYGASHFAVYRYEGGRKWVCVGRRMFGISQIHSLATYQGKLWAGTWPQGYALRYEGGEKWTNTGLLGIGTDKPTQAPINEINALGVHHGKLYAGVLPKAEVWRYEADGQWSLIDSLASRADWDPAVCPSWMRVLSFTTHQGLLFTCTGASQARTQDVDPGLTAGRVVSYQAGAVASHERDIGDGWTHVGLCRDARSVALYVNGKLSQRMDLPERRWFDLGNGEPLRIGSGPTGSFDGVIKDVRLYDGLVEGGGYQAGR